MKITIAGKMDMEFDTEKMEEMGNMEIDELIVKGLVTIIDPEFKVFDEDGNELTEGLDFDNNEIIQEVIELFKGKA